MKPGVLNYALAYGSVVCGEMMIFGCSAVLTVLAIPAAIMCVADAASWGQVLLGVVMPFAAAGVGLLSATVLASVLAGPLNSVGRRINGGPFVPGVTVRILAGRHRGETIEIDRLAARDAVYVYGKKTPQGESIMVWQVRVCRIGDSQPASERI
jgi:hypothetical protein